MTSQQITALVINHVADSLGVDCSSDVPANRPARFVQVRSSGGPGVREIVLDERLLRFAVYAPSDADCEDLSLQVRDTIESLSGRVIGGVPLYEVTCSTPYPFDDDSSPRYIGQATVLTRRDV